MSRDVRAPSSRDLASHHVMSRPLVIALALSFFATPAFAQQRLSSVEQSLQYSGALAGDAGPASLNWIDEGQRLSYTTTNAQTNRPEVRGYDAGADGWVKLDVVTRLTYRVGRELPGEVVDAVLGRIVTTNGLPRLAPDDEFWALALHCLLDRGAVPPPLMTEKAVVEGVRHGRRMCDLFREEHRPVDVLGGLIGIAEQPQIQARYRPGADARIVPAIDQGVRAVSCRAVESKTLLRVLSRDGELAEPGVDRRRGVVGLQAQLVVVLLLGDAEQLVAKLARPVHFRPRYVEQPQPVHDLEALAAVAEGPAQLLGAVICLRRLRCRPSSRDEQGRAERGLKT